VGSLDVAFDDTRGVSGHERSRGHIPYDDARRRNDAMIPDRDPWEDHRMGADKTVIADIQVTIAIVDGIVSEDCGPESYSRVLPDVNSSRVSVVELVTQRNKGSFPEIHLPNPN